MVGVVHGEGVGTGDAEMLGREGSRRGRARRSSVNGGSLTAQWGEEKASGRLKIECQLEECDGGRASFVSRRRPQQASKILSWPKVPGIPYCFTKVVSSWCVVVIVRDVKNPDSPHGCRPIILH